MAKTTNSNTVVILDDEIGHIVWMLDYFENKGLDYLPCSSANEAIDILQEEIYRFAIIDLNVPISPPLDEAARQLGEVYLRYPGLYVARRARNMGYRDRQIVIYSVHRDESVTKIANQIGCTYILKGRPKEIKNELELVVSYDPTD